MTPIYSISNMEDLPARFGVGRPRIYPFNECEVGEGFEVAKRDIQSVRTCLQYWKNTKGTGQMWITRRIAADAYAVKRVL